MKTRGLFAAGHISAVFGSSAAAVVHKAGELAGNLSLPLYLVGGGVRDLVLGKACSDIDLVLEGDAIGFARDLGATLGTTVTSHTRFGTSTLRFDAVSLDIATARAETYPHPGALPVVKPSSIQADLARRDFSINSMAVSLLPGGFGRLLDPFDGLSDIQNKLLRVLHGRSFTDDATRLWRAARYAGRLGFSLEPETRRWLRRDLAMQDTISGDRIRRELMLVLGEDKPEQTLSLADRWSILKHVEPVWRFGSLEYSAFKEARDSLATRKIQPVYLAILFMRLGNYAERLSRRLNLPRSSSKLVMDAAGLWKTAKAVDPENIAEIYHLFTGKASPSIEALSFLGHNNTRKASRLFFDQISKIRTEFDGDALLRFGVPRGPAIKEALAGLLEARLKGQIMDVAGEERWLKSWQGNRRAG
jgi:tRNA nucleotidyltransferase (CCA-adding enzyme)